MMHVPPNGAARRRGGFIALGLIGPALMLIPLRLYADGETSAHVRLHLESSAGVFVVATAVALLWRSPRARFESMARSALLATLTLLAAAQLTESGGALAWEADGETLRSRALHLVHTSATVTGGVALILVGLSALASVAALLARVTPEVLRGAPGQRRS